MQHVLSLVLACLDPNNVGSCLIEQRVAGCRTASRRDCANFGVCSPAQQECCGPPRTPFRAQKTFPPRELVNLLAKPEEALFALSTEQPQILRLPEKRPKRAGRLGLSDYLATASLLRLSCLPKERHHPVVCLPRRFEAHGAGGSMRLSQTAPGQQAHERPSNAATFLFFFVPAFALFTSSPTRLVER